MSQYDFFFFVFNGKEMTFLHKIILAVTSVLLLFSASSQINTYNVSDLTSTSAQKRLQVVNIIIITLILLMWVAGLTLKLI